MIFIFLIHFLFAYDCPPEAKSEQGVKLLEYLTPHVGALELGSCRVEIHTCDDSSGEEHPVSPVAEIYIQAGEREVYLPIRLRKGPLVSYKTRFNDRLFNFNFKDRHYEAEAGALEHYQLEILKKWGEPTTIESVHLGYYRSHFELNQENGNDSHWYICEE